MSDVNFGLRLTRNREKNAKSTQFQRHQQNTQFNVECHENQYFSEYFNRKKSKKHVNTNEMNRKEKLKKKKRKNRKRITALTSHKLYLGFNYKIYITHLHLVKLC